MRGLLIVAALVGLSGCAASGAPPTVFADSGWRSSTGAPLSIGEVEALRRSCIPRGAMLPIDSDQPVPNPIRDNPAYHPGGEGLAGAPPVGIAAADRPIEPGMRRLARSGTASVEGCLYEQGILRPQ